MNNMTIESRRKMLRTQFMVSISEKSEITSYKDLSIKIGCTENHLREMIDGRRTLNDSLSRFGRVNMSIRNHTKWRKDRKCMELSKVEKQRRAGVA